jgi:predicted transcriptional regulator
MKKQEIIQEKMSVTQYANSRGITRAAVLKRLQPEVKPMERVSRAEKVGNTWVLYISK